MFAALIGLSSLTLGACTSLREVPLNTGVGPIRHDRLFITRVDGGLDTLLYTQVAGGEVHGFRRPDLRQASIPLAEIARAETRSFDAQWAVVVERGGRAAFRSAAPPVRAVVRTVGPTLLGIAVGYAAARLLYDRPPGPKWRGEFRLDTVDPVR